MHHEEKILNLLETLAVNVSRLMEKTDGLQENMNVMRAEMNVMRADIDEMRTEMNGMRVQMNHRLERVEYGLQEVNKKCDRLYDQWHVTFVQTGDSVERLRAAEEKFRKIKEVC